MEEKSKQGPRAPKDEKPVNTSDFGINQLENAMNKVDVEEKVFVSSDDDDSPKSLSWGEEPNFLAMNIGGNSQSLHPPLQQPFTEDMGRGGYQQNVQTPLGVGGGGYFGHHPGLGGGPYPPSALNPIGGNTAGNSYPSPFQGAQRYATTTPHTLMGPSLKGQYSGEQFAGNAFQTPMRGQYYFLAGPNPTPIPYEQLYGPYVMCNGPEGVGYVPGGGAFMYPPRYPHTQGFIPEFNSSPNARKKVSQKSKPSHNESDRESRKRETKTTVERKKEKSHDKKKSRKVTADDSDHDSDSNTKKAEKANKGIKVDKKSKRDQGKQKAKPLELVKKPEDLPKHFGRFKRLADSDRKYKTIAKYVENGSHHRGGSQKVGIKIHQIVEYGGPASASSSTPSSSLGATSSKVLLWWKTTPGSVRKLGQQDGCIAFYDVIARAYAVSPKKVKEPTRQTILLCLVSLGKMHNSSHGFRFWAGKEFPGSDSVKCVGKYTPNRDDDRNDDSAIIPCGKVVEHGKYKTYEMDYNEYMVYETRRVRVKYAVDVELIPVATGSSGSDEDDDSQSE